MELRDQQTRATSTAWKPKVKPLPHGTEAETGAWQTRAMTEGVRMTGKPEGRRSQVDPRGWRVEAQSETRKSVPEVEQ